jgi:hypothetical protein
MSGRRSTRYATTAAPSRYPWPAWSKPPSSFLPTYSICAWNLPNGVAHVEARGAADRFEQARYWHYDVVLGFLGEQDRLVDVRRPTGERENGGGVEDEADRPGVVRSAHAALRRRRAAHSRT